MVPPSVADRPPGVPPTPQGAGERAHEVFTGEPDPFEPVDDPQAVLDAVKRDLDDALTGARGCFGGALPPLTVTILENRNTGGARTGYVGLLDGPGGDALSEETDECVMLVLEDLTLAPPPGARRAVVTTSAR